MATNEVGVKLITNLGANAPNYRARFTPRSAAILYALYLYYPTVLTHKEYHALFTSPPGSIAFRVTVSCLRAGLGRSSAIICTYGDGYVLSQWGHDTITSWLKDVA